MDDDYMVETNQNTQPDQISVIGENRKNSKGTGYIIMMIVYFAWLFISFCSLLYLVFFERYLYDTQEPYATLTTMNYIKSIVNYLLLFVLLFCLTSFYLAYFKKQKCVGKLSAAFISYAVIVAVGIIASLVSDVFILKNSYGHFASAFFQTLREAAVIRSYVSNIAIVVLSVITAVKLKGNGKTILIATLILLICLSFFNISKVTFNNITTIIRWLKESQSGVYYSGLGGQIGLKIYDILTACRGLIWPVTLLVFNLKHDYRKYDAVDEGENYEGA